MIPQDYLQRIQKIHEVRSTCVMLSYRTLRNGFGNNVAPKLFLTTKNS